MQQILQNISLKTGAPMESHAATVLTPYAFCKLQDELVVAAHYAAFVMEEGCYLVRHHTKMEGGRKVIWAPSEELITCSCHQFEFTGVLCRHALRVLSTVNCFQLPDRYLPMRWRRVQAVSGSDNSSTSGEHAEKFQALQSMMSTLLSESLKSKERFDIAFEEIPILLSRIKECPVPMQGSR